MLRAFPGAIMPSVLSPALVEHAPRRSGPAQWVCGAEKWPLVSRVRAQLQAAAPLSSPSRSPPCPESLPSPGDPSAQATSPPYNTTSGKLALLFFWPPTGVTPLGEPPAEKFESPPLRVISLIRLLSPPGRIVEILNNFQASLCHCCW